MKNLISISDLSIDDINFIFEKASEYFETNNSISKKINLFEGKTAVNMFFESSTRTRISFQIAEQRMGFDVVNFDASLSSINKKESIKDTCLTLNSMHPDVIVTRHKEEGFAKKITEYFDCPIINAGDGKNEHPTQALLDAFTILKYKKNLRGLEIAICGDVNHSRVAGSNLLLLNKLGAKVRFVGPEYFVSKEKFKNKNVEIFHNFERGIKDVDVIMMLRIQFERLKNEAVPTVKQYHKIWGLNHKRLKLAKKDVIVMHPAPINREVEITGKLADDKNISVIFKQVENGVAIRQAILEWISR